MCYCCVRSYVVCIICTSYIYRVATRHWWITCWQGVVYIEEFFTGIPPKYSPVLGFQMESRFYFQREYMVCSPPGDIVEGVLACKRVLWNEEKTDAMLLRNPARSVALVTCVMYRYTRVRNGNLRTLCYSNDMSKVYPSRWYHVVCTQDPQNGDIVTSRVEIMTASHVA